MMISLIEKVAALHDLRLKACSTVNGGDINAGYQLVTEERTYFLKVNLDKKYPEMFLREAEGLDALRNASTLKVPAVIDTGVIDDKQFLLTEWLNKTGRKAGFWEEFAEGLTELHKRTNDTYGWASSNYIGSLVQKNTPAESWSKFYANERILPLVTALFEIKNFSIADVKAAELLCLKCDEIFPGEPPALRHGDLWAGNFMSVEGPSGGHGIPAIYDPAVYFGHREMDIGMSLLFGGFEEAFYDAYHSIYPLEKGWKQRLPLTQLYPLLVHALIFGGGYITQCREITRKYQ